MPFAGGEIIHGGIAAARATDAFRPATGDQVGRASVLVGEHFFELGSGKLVDRLGASCHGTLPTMEGYCHA